MTAEKRYARRASDIKVTNMITGEIAVQPNRYRRIRIDPQLRREVWVRDHGTCRYCGARWRKNRSFHLDHVKPICRGGLNTLENLVVCCEPCNYAKGTQSWEPLTLEVALWLKKPIDRIKREQRKRKEAPKPRVEATFVRGDGMKPVMKKRPRGRSGRPAPTCGCGALAKCRLHGGR